jgi:hypothetical protein
VNLARSTSFRKSETCRPVTASLSSCRSDSSLISTRATSLRNSATFVENIFICSNTTSNVPSPGASVADVPCGGSPDPDAPAPEGVSDILQLATDFQFPTSNDPLLHRSLLRSTLNISRLFRTLQLSLPSPMFCICVCVCICICICICIFICIVSAVAPQHSDSMDFLLSLPLVVLPGTCSQQPKRRDPGHLASL